MTVEQMRNSGMVKLLSADFLPVRDRNSCIGVYDDTGGQTFTTVITAKLDTIYLNTTPDLFSLASDAVTVAYDGIYQVYAHLTVDHSTGTSQATVEFWIEVDVGAGFVTLGRTTSNFPLLSTGYSSGQTSFVHRLSAGTSLRIRVKRDTGIDTLRLRVGGARMTVTALFLLE